MRRVVYLCALCALFMLAFTPAAFAQADKDCSDFATQPQAQAYFTSHGGSASNNFDNLDADHDGIACEDLPGGSAPASSAPASSTPASSAPATSTPASSAPAAQQYSTPSTGTELNAGGNLPLPNTGGPSLLLPIGTGVLAAGALLMIITRRR